MQVPGQPGAGPGAVAADQDRLLAWGHWELGQGQVDQLDQVVSAASRGVARPQQARQRLTWGLAAVQVGQQRMKTEGVLVGARRALLGVAAGQHQGRIRIHDQHLNVGVGASGPGAGPGVSPGGAQPGQPVGVDGDPFEDPPGGRGRGHLAEQLGLVAQHRQVAQTIATIGQHHRQIA